MQYWKKFKKVKHCEIPHSVLGLYDKYPGEHLGIFWVGMFRPGLQIGTPFLKKKFSPKIDTPF